MNVYLSECSYLQAGLKTATRHKPWRQALALPEDTMTYLPEITKFLGTIALILATGLLMLMMG